MGYVFSSKTTKWFRFKIWFVDLIVHFLALPSYLWPKPLESAPLTEEELAMWAEIEREDQEEIDAAIRRSKLKVVENEEECKHLFGHYAGDGYETCKYCGIQGEVAAKEPK